MQICNVLTVNTIFIVKAPFEANPIETAWKTYLKNITLHSLKYFTTGAYEQEHATPLYFCHGVFIDRFIFKSNLLWMRLPWECHNQSQDTNWRHCVTGPELSFFHKRKGVLKINQSVKMPWHKLSMGVASSCSSAPAQDYSFSCFSLSNMEEAFCSGIGF